MVDSQLTHERQLFLDNICHHFRVQGQMRLTRRSRLVQIRTHFSALGILLPQSVQLPRRQQLQ